MGTQARGTLLVLLAAVLLSTLPTVVKVGLAEAPALSLLAPRLLLGAALLWVWLAATRPHRLRIDSQGRWDTALAGGLNGLSLTFFYLGMQYTGASIVILVFTCYPALLLLWLRLRGEAVTRLDIVRLLLALAGIWLVASPGGGADPRGVLFGLASAFVYSLYILVIHTRLVSYPATTQAVWVVTFLALAVSGARVLLLPFEPLSWTAWGVVLWSGILGTAIGRVLMMSGIRLLGGGQTALLMPAETVMTVTWAALILGERLSVVQMLGAALVLGSVVLATARQGLRRRARSGDPRENVGSV